MTFSDTKVPPRTQVQVDMVSPLLGPLGITMSQSSIRSRLAFTVAFSSAAARRPHALYLLPAAASGAQFTSRTVVTNATRYTRLITHLHRLNRTLTILPHRNRGRRYNA